MSSADSASSSWISALAAGSGMLAGQLTLSTSSQRPQWKHLSTTHTVWELSRGNCGYSEFWTWQYSGSGRSGGGQFWEEVTDDRSVLVTTGCWWWCLTKHRRLVFGKALSATIFIYLFIWYLFLDFHFFFFQYTNKRLSFIFTATVFQHWCVAVWNSAEWLWIFWIFWNCSLPPRGISHVCPLLLPFIHLRFAKQTFTVTDAIF